MPEDQRRKPGSDELDGEDTPRDRLKPDPDAPPARANEEMPAPDKPFKDQGDALEQR